jgi:hypothetical protein
MTNAAILPGSPVADALSLRMPSRWCAGGLAATTALQGKAGWWKELVGKHVRSRNECALIRAIASAADVLTPVERLQACWIPCLMAMEEARCSGRPLACTSAVAHFIAVSARVALTRYPVRANAPWLVGLSLIDQSASHLIALLHARQGFSVRPWWSPELPKRGAYVMVSIFAFAGPFPSDKRCRGSLSLADEAWMAEGRLLEDVEPS